MAAWTRLTHLVILSPYPRRLGGHVTPLIVLLYLGKCGEFVLKSLESVFHGFEFGCDASG